MAAASKKVPVTILTGHLGAGKTTLLRRMLRNKFGIRIAVIENEFGDEVGIERLFANTNLDGTNEDDDITVIQSKDLFVELSNGCVCCSVKDNLVSTLEQLLQRNENRFDHIVIETTGLADPGPLAGIFWLDDELECEMALDGVLCVVDVANILPRLDAGDRGTGGREAEAQIAYADRIILNKCDLLLAGGGGGGAGDQFQRVVNRVRAINPIARMERSVLGGEAFDLEFCFNIHAYDNSRLLQQVNASSASSPAAPLHDAAITSFVLRKDDGAGMDVDKLRSWIALLLWEPYAGDIFRLKGVVHSRQEPDAVFALQGVHSIFDLAVLPGKTWQRDVDEARPVTKIVVIGRHLDRARITQEFHSL